MCGRTESQLENGTWWFPIVSEFADIDTSEDEEEQDREQSVANIAAKHESSESNISSDGPATGKKTFRKTHWQPEEVALVRQQLGGYLAGKNTTVRQKDIVALASALPGRSHAQIRAKVSNMKLEKKRKMKV